MSGDLLKFREAYNKIYENEEDSFVQVILDNDVSWSVAAGIVSFKQGTTHQRVGSFSGLE